jgi:hypothetical protein
MFSVRRSVLVHITAQAPSPGYVVKLQPIKVAADPPEFELVATPPKEPIVQMPMPVVVLAEVHLSLSTRKIAITYDGKRHIYAILEGPSAESAGAVEAISTTETKHIIVENHALGIWMPEGSKGFIEGSAAGMGGPFTARPSRPDSPSGRGKRTKGR